MDMKRILLGLCLLSVGATAVCGQERYYRPVEGLKKAELKSALCGLIQPEQVLDYGGRGEGYTWAGFAEADRMPDGVTVRDRYSDIVREFDGLEAVPGMNIEHVFANSWWGHTVNNAYCDLFNLFPSDASANGRKSNNPMGMVTGKVSFDNGVTRVGQSASYREDSLITVWEPADRWKGDFARTFFYMATCYEGLQDEWQTNEGLLVVEKNRYPTLRPWVSRMLLEWSEADPVDDIERERNEAVYGIQGNRNPFVDYPQLADYIWGDSMEYAFYTDRTSAEAELFVPEPDAVIDYGLQAVSKGMDKTLTVRGRNLPGGLVLQVDNPDFVLACQDLTGEEVTQGMDVDVSCREGLSAGEHTGTLTFSGDGFTQEVVLRVEFVDGIPAYPAEELVCTTWSRRFTASWMDMGGGTYSLEVYTKDAQGNPQMLGGYPQETTAAFMPVEDLQASTTYYYRVNLLDGEGQVAMTSNEVEVVMPEVEPVFSAEAGELVFTSVPGRPSVPQTLGIKALSLPEYMTTVATETPFEVSADGVEWGQSATVSGYDEQTVWVRLGCVDEAGHMEGELVLSTPGVDHVIVSLSGEVDGQKSFFETFETGNKSAYAESNVTCAVATWRMAQALIGNLENDRKNDGRSVRMQAKNGTVTELEMLEDKTGGCDSLWFYAGLYGSDTGVKLSVSYSQDGGMTWTPVVEDMGFAKGEWRRYGYELGVDGLVRLKFTVTGSSSKRLNVDDIQMSDYGGQGTGVETPGTIRISDEDIVDVYTLGGIKVRTAKRKDALRGLKPDYYIVR